MNTDSNRITNAERDKCGGGDLLVRAMVRAGNSLLHLAQSLLQPPIWRYGHSRCAPLYCICFLYICVFESIAAIVFLLNPLI